MLFTHIVTQQWLKLQVLPLGEAPVSVLGSVQSPKDTSTTHWRFRFGALPTNCRVGCSVPVQLKHVYFFCLSQGHFSQALIGQGLNHQSLANRRVQCLAQGHFGQPLVRRTLESQPRN